MSYALCNIKNDNSHSLLLMPQELMTIVQFHLSANRDYGGVPTNTLADADAGIDDSPSDVTRNTPPGAAANRFKVATGDGGRGGSTVKTTQKSVPASTSSTQWKLPVRNSPLVRQSPLSREEIAKEFRRLDILGEGRLTFLHLKTALDLRGIEEEDSGIRRWLRENDIGEKGYVDFSDYEQIYRDSYLLSGDSIVDSKSTQHRWRGSGIGIGDSEDGVAFSKSIAAASTGRGRGSNGRDNFRSSVDEKGKAFSQQVQHDQQQALRK